MTAQNRQTTAMSLFGGHRRPTKEVEDIHRRSTNNRINTPARPDPLRILPTTLYYPHSDSFDNVNVSPPRGGGFLHACSASNPRRGCGREVLNQRRMPQAGAPATA